MRAGIVGLGARIAHIGPYFKAARPGFEFAACADPTPAGLEHLRRSTGDPVICHNGIDEMIAAERLDFLMIGSPNLFHIEHLRAALRSDIPHIFTEKPVVISEDETFELLDLMRGHGGHERVMVGLVLRYAPLYVLLQDSLKAGHLGNVVSIEASEHIAPYHGSFFMRDWRRYTRLSGGFMLEKCCHDIDLYQGVTGSRARKVASFGGRKSFVPENRPPEGVARTPTWEEVKPHLTDMPDPFTPRWGGGNTDYESDGDIVDYQTALVEYESGAAMAFHTNTNVPDEFRRFAIIGTKGMAEGDFVRNTFKVTDARTYECLIDNPSVGPGAGGHYGADEAMARDIMAWIAQGVPLKVSVLDALAAGLTAIKIDEARLSGQVVDLGETWERFDSYK